MKKQMTFAFLFLFVFSCVWAAAPQEDPLLVQRLQQAIEEKAENAALSVARSSVVQIEFFWQGSGGNSVRALCKGVLINEGRQLVAPANCLYKPDQAVQDAKIKKIFLNFSNGYIIGFEQMPVRAKSFIYWDMPYWVSLEDIEFAELSVADNNNVTGHMGYDLEGKPLPVEEQEFVFHGKRGWEFGAFALANTGFTLRGALTERQLGEPVFIGKRLIALNIAGGDEGFNLSYPFRRPLFLSFTKDNGGEILKNL